MGLYFLRARYLDVQSGRFWTQDSWEGSQDNPSSLHQFLYTKANPINEIDFSGNFSITATTTVLAGFQTLSNMSLIVQQTENPYPDRIPISDEVLIKQFTVLLSDSICRNFVRDLITKTAQITGVPYHSTNPFVLFELIRRQKGYRIGTLHELTLGVKPEHRKSVGGRALGTIFGGDAQVLLAPSQYSLQAATPHGLARYLYLSGEGALHETIHHAGVGRKYTDRELAEAAAFLTKVKPPTATDKETNSPFWDKILEKKCPFIYSGPK